MSTDDDPPRERRSAAIAAGAVAAVSLAFLAIGLARPADIELAASSFDLCLAGLVGFGAVAAVGACMRGTTTVRPLAFLVGGVGLAVMTGVTLLIAVLGGGSVRQTEVAVPDTDLTMSVVTGDGPLGEDAVVLQGHLGPLPRRRVVASLSHSCTASIKPVGPRTIEATMTELTEACGSVGRGGTYLINVGADGWSITIERVTDS